MCLSIEIDLEVFSLDRLGNNLVLGGDYCYFDSIGLSFDWDSFFHVIMGFLDAVKALDHMVFHTILFFGDGGDSLYKSNHSLVTLGIEFTIVTCFDVLEKVWSFLDRVPGYFWLYSIFEIGKESQSILQLNWESLVVNGRPFACQMLRGAIYAIFTENCLNLEFVHEFHFPNVFFSEGKLVVFANNLEPIKIKSVNKLILELLLIIFYKNKM